MGVVSGSTNESAEPRWRLDWDALRAFSAVAETGSFSAAAKLLGLTQPTVSQRIKELEDRLGVTLVLRATSGATLTETGEQIRDHVASMGRSAKLIERMLADHDKRNEGRVRIHAPDGIIAFWLAPRLAEFQRANPEIQLSLDAALWPSDSLRQDVDISLQFEENQSPDNVVIPLGTAHYLAYASTPYLDLYGRPTTPADLARHRFLRHAAQSRQPETWNPHIGALMTLWGGHIETNSSPAVLYAVQAGAGLALLPSSISLWAPELEVIGPTPLGSLKCWLVYHSNMGQIARVRRVIEWLKDVFDPKTNPWFRDDFIHPREFPELQARLAKAAQD